MAKHNVQVVVKARDEASRKFKIIGSSALGMGSMIRKAAAMAAVYFSARAVKRYADESLAAYGQQEMAVTKLAQTLKATGHAAGLTLEELKAYAVELQGTTKISDEATLSTMSLLATFKGIKGDIFKESIEAILDVNAGLSNTKGESVDLAQTALQLGKALNEPTIGLTALRRVGISFSEEQIKQIKNLAAQNKLFAAQRIMLDELNSQFGGQAKASAETYTGVVAQMKNELGDVKEEVGFALMPVFKAWAERTRDWARQNKEAIGDWARKAMSYTILVKDAFVDFVQFMQKDWRSGMQFVFDSFVDLVEAAFKSAVTLAIAGGKGIWKGVKEGLMGGAIKQNRIDYIARDLYEQSGGTFGKEMRGGVHSGSYGGGAYYEQEIFEDKALYEKMRKRAEAHVLADETKEILGSTLDTVKGHWKKAFADIAANAPADLAAAVGEAHARHEARLAAIGKETAGLYGGAGGGGAGSLPEAMAKAAAGAIPKLQFEEARFLTLRRGQTFDPARQTAKNTKEQVGQLKGLAGIMKQMVGVLEKYLGANPITSTIGNLAMTDLMH